MGGTASKSTATSSTDADEIHPRKRIAQNFLLIWVDAGIDNSKLDCQNTLVHLRSIVNDTHIFTNPSQCIQFLNGIENEKAFVIISGSLGQHLVPDIHHLPQLDAIYIFCGNKSRHEEWAKEWIKIKGIYTDIEPICQALQHAGKQCNQDSIAVSFVSIDEGASNQILKQLAPTFMCIQIFKDILLEMGDDEKSIKALTLYCRNFYNDNMAESTVINEFEHSYQSKSAIWWYTRECFIYQMLKRALRTLEGDTIINMGFFIRDLHKQIQELHRRQIGSYGGLSFTVYRGQGLLKSDFEKLVKSKGGLMSFDNFMSTSTKRDMPIVFANDAVTKTNMVGILFKMTINPSISSTPFAFIREVSYFETEEEVLFSMHTVFRIGEINKIDNNSSLYQVDLKLTTDDDQQFRTLTERIRNEVVGETGWKRLGQLLIKLSQFDKAEELYNVLLEQTSDEGEKALYYNQLGCIKDDQNDYGKAIEYFDNALEVYKKALPPNYSSLATSFNNVGLVYKHMKAYTNAISCYEKALQMEQKAVPVNYPHLATSYNNIGFVYKEVKEYAKALSSYEKALEIRQKTVSPNHFDLATSYNNIGLVYKTMGEYAKALSSYEQALEIYKKTVPPNHNLLATSYNNIASTYENMREYSTALAYFQRALNTQQRSIPPNHLNIQNLRDNIEIVKKKL